MKQYGIKPLSENEQLKEKLSDLLKWMEARYLKPKEYKRAQWLLDNLKNKQNGEKESLN